MFFFTKICLSRLLGSHRVVEWLPHPHSRQCLPHSRFFWRNKTKLSSDGQSENHPFNQPSNVSNSVSTIATSLRSLGGETLGVVLAVFAFYLQVKSDVKEAIDATDKRISGRFDGTDKRFDATDKRFDAIDRNVKEQMDRWLQISSEKVDAQDKMIEGHEKMIEGHDRKIESLPKRWW